MSSTIEGTWLEGAEIRSGFEMLGLAYLWDIRMKVTCKQLDAYRAVHVTHNKNYVNK